MLCVEDAVLHRYVPLVLDEEHGHILEDILTTPGLQSQPFAEESVDESIGRTENK